jgi:hypothetical protein
MRDESTQPPALNDDLLHGATEIAAFTGLDRRQVIYHVSRGRLPVWRMGAKICARKSTLLAHFARLEDASCATASARPMRESASK